MNKHQITGRAESVKGKLKEAAGDLTDNNRLKAEGKMEQASGKAKAAAGDALDKTKKALDDKR